MLLKNKVVVLFIILLISFNVPHIDAQEDVIYLCIKPTTNEAPYLVGFRSTDLVGFVISERADVVVYGGNVYVGLYDIIPDAQSGGYRRIQSIGTVQSTINDTQERACSKEYANLITPDLPLTISLPLDRNRAIVIQANGSDEQLQAPFIGNIAFHFVMGESETAKNLQVIQLEAGPIDLTFPFITERTDYVLIANKEITVKKSYFTDSEFWNTAVANEQRGLNEQLKVELALNLFDILDTAPFNIYPAFGFADEYFPPGFVRLEVGDSAALRDPQFSAGQTVIPLSIEGIKAKYYLPGNPEASGALQSIETGVLVDSVDAQGQLIIDISGEKYILEAWLVEVKP